MTIRHKPKTPGEFFARAMADGNTGRRYRIFIYVFDGACSHDSFKTAVEHAKFIEDEPGHYARVIDSQDNTVVKDFKGS